MRLIDADKLYDDIVQYRDENMLGGGNLLVDDILEDINLSPTVDAEPVRHGKWIVTAGGKVCTCSVCGDEFDNTCNYDIRKDWKCCPVCKCLMDGE